MASKKRARSGQQLAYTAGESGASSGATTAATASPHSSPIPGSNTHAAAGPSNPAHAAQSQPKPRTSSGKLSTSADPSSYWSWCASTNASGGPLVKTNEDLDIWQERFWERQMRAVEVESSSLALQQRLPQEGAEMEGAPVLPASAGDRIAAGPCSFNPDGFKPGPGQLPLARIKKVMKADDEIKMISAEAPIIFARACEVFISDLTCRAYLEATSHKRRTITRSDVSAAIRRSDLFDFLIDVAPRSRPKSPSASGNNATAEMPTTEDSHLHQTRPEQVVEVGLNDIS
ncbi:related to ccaat-binding transcription factor subunit aab-1 [Ceraceosorus bombacis]|uniref:Related to ccaat-binding transcription factor subunit aab-1 n=1 Tax=Ceraceosorus bombacis TaxID=401625 RepID=A0A0P1BD61_9BASI|nr:related to ccaat-binding transcription factor subunit aab-1 [Ceraceosorus bombacis]